MKKQIKLYNFPFSNIENFLDFEVDKKLSSFYNSFNNEYFSHKVKSIDTEKQEVKFYKDFYTENEDEYSVFTFKDDIKYHFKSLIIKSLKIVADGINICFISKQSTYNYLDKLERQYKTLLNNKTLINYPFLKLYLEDIDKEIKYYRGIDNVEEDNEIFKNSPFKPKTDYRRPFFYELYNISQSKELIGLDYSKEDFIEVFTDVSTNKHITFTCNNSLIITFFESIKTCFDNLNQKSIGRYKRFKTKQGNILTETNYSSTKKRLKDNSDILLLKEELEHLLSDS